ncbi:MAG: ThiF family adenylyltransferase, partial [Rhodospirillales bacterium]|nr:ThiF family adenylyltransferase [Rhodospirillales bacterium]
MNFDYKEAFSRNLGLLTPHEQDLLKSKKVAIAGMGGVGGVHLQTLARMGISNFHIADMDVFELANFNRQAGAMVSTLHLPKADVLKRMAEDINPECKITVFSEGVTDENMEAFLDGVDVYVDGLDFFVLDVRARLFEKCREKGIPAVTVGPIGISSACLIFHPKGMSF